MKKEKKIEVKDLDVDVVVVGAGPAGLMAARQIQKNSPNDQILCLESSEHFQGRVTSGLHLADADKVSEDWVTTSEEFKGTLIRWDREWVEPAQVKWEDKDWGEKLPQWDLYFNGTKKVISALSEQDLGVAIKTETPVFALDRLEAVEGVDYKWLLQTPAQKIRAKRVVWAAGLVAFQNAFGKVAARQFAVVNPLFSSVAKDYRGGIAAEFIFQRAPQFQGAEDLQSYVLGIPVRHNGKLSLMFGVCLHKPETNQYVFRALMHVHRDLFLEPKEVVSLQKSMKRSFKNILVEAEGNNVESEKWMLHSRIFGHSMGLETLLGEGETGSLEFVGDETRGAGVLEKPSLELQAVKRSVESLSDLNGLSSQELVLSEPTLVAAL